MRPAPQAQAYSPRRMDEWTEADGRPAWKCQLGSLHGGPPMWKRHLGFVVVRFVAVCFLLGFVAFFVVALVLVVVPF